MENACTNLYQKKFYNSISTGQPIHHSSKLETLKHLPITQHITFGYAMNVTGKYSLNANNISAQKYHSILVSTIRPRSNAIKSRTISPIKMTVHTQRMHIASQLISDIFSTHSGCTQLSQKTDHKQTFS